MCACPEGTWSVCDFDALSFGRPTEEWIWRARSISAYLNYVQGH